MTVEQRYFSVPEAAQYLGTTVAHVRELIKRRAVPYTKVGQLVRFDRKALDAWLADHTIPAQHR